MTHQPGCDQPTPVPALTRDQTASIDRCPTCGAVTLTRKDT